MPFHHTLHFENDVPNAQRTCEDFYQLVELIRKSRKTKEQGRYIIQGAWTYSTVLGIVAGKKTDNLRDLSQISWSAMRRMNVIAKCKKDFAHQIMICLGHRFNFYSIPAGYDIVLSKEWGSWSQLTWDHEYLIFNFNEAISPFSPGTQT